MFKNRFLTFLVKKSIYLLWKFAALFRARSESKKNQVLEIKRSQMFKLYVYIKRIDGGKNSDTDKKSLVERNEQCWENNGKIEIQNWCKTRKQQKKLFKM